MAADPGLLEDVLRRMARIRAAELYVARRYPEGTMRCPTHLCVGQESTAGVFGALADPGDAFLGNYRSHGHYLAKGGSLAALFAELRGAAAGCSGGLGGSMHVIDLDAGFYGSSAIVAATVPIATGIALAFRRRGVPNVAVVFFGDAALEEGVVYESVNFAVLHRLPVVFVCENNGLAISTPLALRAATATLHRRFETLGLPGVWVDGADVVALIAAADAAVAGARRGDGPTFVECTVSRWAGHVGHVVSGPVDAWWREPFAAEAKHCPLARTAAVLVERGRRTLGDLAALHDELEREVAEAFAAAETLPPPAPAAAADAVYASGLESVLPGGAAGASALPRSGWAEPSRLVNPF